jgi:hypothetical protein
MPINKENMKNNPLPEPPKEENVLQKLWGLYNEPFINHIPGAKEALDKALAPGIKEGYEQNFVDKYRKKHFLARLMPTNAEWKGFLQGVTEGINPSVVAAAASLGSGAPATIANTLMAVEGAHNAMDSKLPVWQRVLGGVSVPLAGAGAASGALKMQGAAKAVAEATKGTEAASTATTAAGSGLRILEDVKKATPNSPGLAAKHAALASELEKKPGADLAKKIYGKDGAPPAPTVVEERLAEQEGADILAKKAKEAAAAEATATKMNQNDAAEEVRIELERQAAATKAAKQEETDINGKFKANADANKGLAKAEAIKEKVDARDAKEADALRRKIEIDRDLADKEQVTRNAKAEAERRAEEVTRANANAEDAKRTAEAAAARRKLEIDRDLADKEQAFRDLKEKQAELKAQKEQAAADRQAKLNALKEGLEPKTSPVRESIRGQEGAGNNGGTDAATVTYVPKEAEEGAAAALGGGNGTGPAPKPAPTEYTGDPFYTKPEALKHARENGYGPGEWDIVSIPGELRADGGRSATKYTIKKKLKPFSEATPEEQAQILGDAGLDAETPETPAEPEAPKPKGGGVAQALEKNRPWNKLSQKEQEALLPHLHDAVEGGFDGDVEALGDELADRYLGHKDLFSDDSMDTLNNLLSRVKASGGIYDDGSEEITKLKQLFGSRARSFIKKSGMHNGPKGPKDLDVLHQSIKSGGNFSNIKNEKDLYQALTEAAQLDPSNRALEDFTSKIPGEWWRKPTAEITDYTSGDVPTVDVQPPPTQTTLEVPAEGPSKTPPPPSIADAARDKAFDNVANKQNMSQNVVENPNPVEAPPVEDPMSVEDFAGKLSEEGNKPIAEVPYTLDGGSGPAAPELENPSLLPEGVDPALKAEFKAVGEAYGKAKAAKDPAARELGARLQQLHRQFVDSNPTLQDLEDLDPIQKNKVLKDLVRNWGSGDNQKGFAATDLAARTALGMAGGAVGYEEDPFGNRPLSGLAGAALGATAPSLLPASVNVLSRSATALQPYGEKFLDIGNRFHNSGLLGPSSVLKKAAGDVGGLTLAAAEHPSQAGRIIGQFLTPEGRSLIKDNFMAGIKNNDQEDLSGIENFFQDGRNPLSWSGRTMGGLTNATKGILGEAGFTVPQQRYYTLTATPSHPTTAGMYKLLRGYDSKVKGDNVQKGSKILQHLAPFAKIGVNRLERGIEYSPLGLFNRDVADPNKALDIAKKAVIGTGVMGATYALTPDDFVKNHPIAAPFISAAGGPLGVPILASMAAKNVHLDQGDSSFGEKAKDTVKKFGDMSQAVGKDIPGMRLLEDITGRSFPVGFLRNYLSGYTNVTSQIAPLTNPGEREVSSPDLPLEQQIFNRAISNVPGLRGLLPLKDGSPEAVEGLPPGLDFDPRVVFGPPQENQ